MKPTAQKASFCYKYMMGGTTHVCVKEIWFLIWLCFGDEKQGLSISQPLLMQIYLSPDQLHKLLKLQRYIVKTKQTNIPHRTENPHNYNDLNPVLTW